MAEGRIIACQFKSVVLTKGEAFLDGVEIDYLYFPQEGFEITHPGMGHHGHH